MSNTYRPRYHITPPQGRLNDPNGMFLDGDTLHVFYQHDPAFPFGDKRTGWGHASTTLDSLIWQHHPDALYPDAAYDLHGCYSGGAVRDDDGTVYLFYTGNLKKPDADTGGFIRRATQNRVRAEAYGQPMGGIYRRDARNPLIDGPAEGFTAHYRDPMITKNPTPGKKWRMVIGAQRVDETGAVVLYHADDLGEWEYVGEITFDTSHAQPGTSPDLVPGGYMWECPNLITLKDQVTGENLDVLVMCPQGLTPVEDADGTTHYASSDQCGYLVGKLEGTTFVVSRGFSELDYGHQFYAPQLIAGPDDTAIMVGWMGLPGQDETPTVSAEGWVHCLTTPRLLSLSDHRLVTKLMVPEQDVTVIRETVDQDPREWEIANGGARVEYQPGVLAVTVGEDRRQAQCGPGDVVIYIDGCAVEVTGGNGEVAFSLVVF